jgi:hypothetical protein
LCCCRDEILGTTVKDFHEFADVLAAVRDKGQVVAVTSGGRKGGWAGGRAGIPALRLASWLLLSVFQPAALLHAVWLGKQFMVSISL